MPPPGNGAPTWKACVNLMKVMMSAGILAQPSVAHKLGLGYWFCAWSLSMGVSGYTMWLVSKSYVLSDALPGGRARTLSELTLKITRWRKLAALVEAAVCLLQFAFAGGYVVVVLGLVKDDLLPSLGRWAVALALVPASACAAGVVDLEPLTYVSAFGIAVTLVGVVGVSTAYGLSHRHEFQVWGHRSFTPDCGWADAVRHVGSILYGVCSRAGHG